MENLPLWPFKPNWTNSVDEGIEFKTSVLTSTSGAEQRRSMRPSPRYDYSYTMLVNNTDRAWCDNFLRGTSGFYWAPIWDEAVYKYYSTIKGLSKIPIENADKRRFKVGSPVAFISDLTCKISEIKEVLAIASDSITIDSPLSSIFSGEVIIAPAIKAYLEPSTNGLQFTTHSDKTSSCAVKMYCCDTDEPVIKAQTNGPLIYNGLIVNSWARSLGRGGYFHQDSGTSEGQFIFLRAAIRASLALENGTPLQVRASQWFRQLAYKMADALGDGNPNGPMLRQPIPTNVDTLCELHWLFAARGDIPERSIVYALQANSSNGKIVIPQSARGGSVYKVYMIYPSTSQLLYNGTTSPGYDIEKPSEKTQTTLSASDWSVSGLSTVISVPENNDSGQSNGGVTSWKIVYGYENAGIIPITYGYEAFPDWTLIDPYYAACAPDTFRWFDLAAKDLISFDTRDSTGKWDMLRKVMRRTCVKGQNIDDLRTILTPMKGFSAIPVTGDPTGMYCSSNHPDATTTSVAGANPAWLGYDWWSRDDDGNIVGEIPSPPVNANSAEATAAEIAAVYAKASGGSYDYYYNLLLPDYLKAGLKSENQLYQTQIGRGFSDSWRQKTNYQDADYYMYVEVSCNRALADGEHILFYMSATANYDPSTRWFAVLDKQADWKTDGSLCKLFIPISEFNTRADESVGSTTWGSPLNAGQTFENYGLSVEVASGVTVRLGEVRPISGASQASIDANRDEAVKGSKMPFFGGSLPFAINLNAKNQKFVGWNGSPFHGYQQPDLWLECEDDAEAVHPDLDPSKDLPIPDNTGALTFPIQATDSDGTARSKASMLCEQQCYFLQKAQEQYHADGGSLGPFAHTFVLNTPARSSLGWPTPHTWVYVNDDPNTRWIGYQVRPVESLARLAMLTKDKVGWQTVHTQALTLVLNWLNWFNGAWTSSNQTIFTDYPDPRQSAPQANYDEPHAAALILRACLWLKSINALTYADDLILRLWDYLERIWAYNQGTNMAGTWSDDPVAEDWYGFWHGEIILTITTMLENPALLPSSRKDGLISTATERLMETYDWLRNVGVKDSNQSELDGFDNWNGYAIFPFSPNFGDNSSKTYSRNYINFDSLIGVPVWWDSAGRQFESWSEEFILHGRESIINARNFFLGVKGQQTPFWYPSFATDFELQKDIHAGDTNITVKPCGYVDYTATSGNYNKIIITLLDGSYVCANIIKYDKSSVNEIIGVDTAFLNDIPMSKVDKISFLNLARFASDRIEISHLTDSDGTATISTIIKTAPEIREARANLE